MHFYFSCNIKILMLVNVLNYGMFQNVSLFLSNIIKGMNHKNLLSILASLNFAYNFLISGSFGKWKFINIEWFFFKMMSIEEKYLFFHFFCLDFGKNFWKVQKTCDFHKRIYFVKEIMKPEYPKTDIDIKNDRNGPFIK